jgi:hypothetical protein
MRMISFYYSVEAYDKMFEVGNEMFVFLFHQFA